MTHTHAIERKVERPRQLRLWPGVIAVCLQLLMQYVVPVVAQEAAAFAFIAGVVGALAVLVWWAFFSRAPVLERLLAVLLIAVGLVATRPFLDRSITNGMMGMLFVLYAGPALGVALVAWAVTSRRLALKPRMAILVAMIVFVCGLFTLLRTDGITGEARSQFAWRWTKTSEERLLAHRDIRNAAIPPPTTPQPSPQHTEAKHSISDGPTPDATIGVKQPAVSATTRAEWPGFRGPRRDGIVTGVRIETNWASTPPVELWRREVGPGWSSFAVAGDRLYTQEQRGEFEVVACYRTTTGEPVWAHRDTARFWESNAGAGPRGTPTIQDGHVYTFGATGIVNALAAADGRVLWTRNAAADTGAKLPGWGFSSSPLVVENLVIVAAAGKLVAYDRASGAPQWRATDGGASYSSPQLLTIDGVPQVVLMDSAGATSFAPADGTVLWKHSWQGDSPILQPVLAAEHTLLIATNDMSGGAGTRKLTVTNGPAGWKADEVWTSKGLKPYFNDFVVHGGHAFGFDGSILACVDLKDGARKWKGGRYGHGQMLLLPEQNLLLVLSEEGELALVSATPEKFSEIARIPAMHDKTWNHPVITANTLLVRNGQEMVAFRLPVGGS